MPQGIGGNRAPNGGAEAMVLLKATCEDCREATRKFEEDFQIGSIGPARARLKMNRKDRAKLTRKARIIYRDGRDEECTVGIDYLPGAMVIPDMPTAAVFLGLDWRPDTKVKQIVINDGSRLRDPDVHKISVQVTIHIASFARMLCKIALGVAHYTFGPDAFTPVAREFIKEGRGHPNHFVGGFADVSGAPTAPPGTLHNIGLFHHQGLLVATIQLFAPANGPVNYAVVGPLRQMPPGLPPLHLGPPLERQNRTDDQPATDLPTAAIQWDQIAP